VRYIGIRHRTKRTVNDEARPTQVAIIEDDKVTTYELDNEQDELDWVFGIYPRTWRKLEPGEAVPEGTKPHHIKEKGEDDDKVIHIPQTYDGFQAGDLIAMGMGGSGDRLAFAISRRSELTGGGNIMRLPPVRLKEARGEATKDGDAQLLAELVRTSPDKFYMVTPRDRDLIALTFVLDERTEAMRARMACQQRLRRRFIGQIFCSPEGLYPQGALEDEYQRVEANDMVLQSLFREEGQCNKRLEKAVKQIAVYTELFAPIKGVGPAIASPIIVGIGDVRRFATSAKLKKFCGVHVMLDGRFPRKRRGEVCNWRPGVRQALFLLGDQFNRRPDTAWGQRLLWRKAKLREIHPEVVLDENGKKKYTKGHIHKMALWKTLTDFVVWLHKEWTKLETQPMLVEESKASNF
jgi:hypothetical protein